MTESFLNRFGIRILESLSEGVYFVVIYDIMGQVVKTLVDHDVLNPGKYTVEWNSTDDSGQKVASGIYFARLKAGGYQQTIKMNLLK